MKNLVLGFAKGYNWYILEPFIRSFIKNVPNADMVLFMENYSDFTRSQLEQVKDKPSGGKIIIEPVPNELQNVFPANSRWKFSADYIEAHGANYGQIFISDTRDVIFQGDIFECYKNFPKYLACAEEDFAGYIGSDKTVCEWIENAYGKDELAKMKNKFMFCPSTVAGTYEEIKIFSRKMWDYMPKNVDFYGLDLATECYIMYNNLVPVENIMEVRCHEGAIMSSFWLIKFCVATAEFLQLFTNTTDMKNLLRLSTKFIASRLLTPTKILLTFKAVWINFFISCRMKIRKLR